MKINVVTDDIPQCGTCHMAFLFMLLPRAATSTICSTNVLLNNISSRNILHFNHPLVVSSYPCASTKSIRCNSYLLRTTAFLMLGKPHENSGTNFYARNQLLAKNNTDYTQRTSPKVLPPNQGCPTVLKRSEGTHDSSCTSSHLRSWCISRNFRAITKSTLRKTSLVKTSIPSHAYHSSWNSDDDFTAENNFWLQIALITLSAPHQRCQHHTQGALLFKKNSELNNAASCASSYHLWWCTSHDLRPLPGPISLIFSALTIFYVCRQTSLAWTFTL